jgi:hypothetical protein
MIDKPRLIYKNACTNLCELRKRFEYIEPCIILNKYNIKNIFKATNKNYKNILSSFFYSSSLCGYDLGPPMIF